MLIVTQSETLPVSEARAGEAEAWNTLFKRYQLPLYVYVFELVRDEQSSLDIVQETFIAASRNIKGLREDEKFGSWLFGIAHQQCIRQWRKRRLESTPLDEADEDTAQDDSSPDEWLIRKEQEKWFMESLNQLSPAHRSVILLHFMEDFSLEEIAAIVGVGIGTVKSRLHYAKLSLRKLMNTTL